ncbi:uncharacterized protein LOC127713909 [Mytilus californianus]|uniref:uncharacterized protein LOC127713909 n=1 Tax=Mytilus californianus TaxID=6549 RepID=UPI0022453CBC|nr:uncharacterized protein LOC127713909 [Mytilus californianus]XP_052075822.1 uncharacterized protein LOC127713909 [Mytilus californianus]
MYICTFETHEILVPFFFLDGWSLEKLKQNVWQEYLFWHCVIAVVEESVELSFKENMPIIFENLNYSSVNVSVFLRKNRNKMKSVFKKKDLSIGKEQAIGIAFKDVGPICEKEGISLDWLKNPSPIPNKIDVTNGLIVELRKVRMQHSILHKTVALWVQFLCHLNYTPDSDGLKCNIELVYKKLSKISLHDRQNVSAYLTEQYIPPQKGNTLCNSDSNEKRNSSEKVDNKRFQDYINNASHKFAEQKNIIIDLEKKLEKTRQQKFSANLKLFKIRKEHKKVTAKYTDSLSKMSELSTRNVNKRLKRKQTSISQLTSEKNKHEKEIKYLRQRNKNIKRKYKGQSALLRYYRNKNLKKENSNETVDSIKKSGIRTDSDMENRMKYLENENEILKENIEDLMKSQIVQTFHGGKYNDTIREVYASLLSMNVGVCNVEKIVRTVLEKMGGGG